MMGFTLSRYIARMFFVAIVSTLAVCALLIFMIDFVELLRMSGKFGDVPGTTLVRIALLRLPAYIEFLIGFAVLVGSISALIYLNRKSELAVMRAGGMSVWQFLGPGLFVGLAVGFFAMMI
ncbi:MAG TPA: LptF/LptG family permease, partial [Hyphomicrobium sp.]